METRTKVAQQIKSWQVSGARRIPVDITFLFDPDEPPVVTLAFSAPGGLDTVDWAVARDLLIGALDSSVPVGYGDVRLWLVESRGLPMLRLHLLSDGSTGLFDIPARQVQKFVQATRDSVPRAAEGAWFRSALTDIALGRLIDSGPQLSICPVCRALDCLNADHARVREDIRVDQMLKMQIEATDD